MGAAVTGAVREASGGQSVGDGGEPLGDPAAWRITRPGVQRHPGSVIGLQLRGGGTLLLGHRQLGVLRGPSAPTSATTSRTWNTSPW